MPSVKGTIDKIVQRPQNGTAPIILEFQNGELRPSDDSDTRVFLARDKRKANEKLAVLATNKFVYSGKINDCYATDLVDTYVAIRDVRTNKVCLVQVDQANMKNTIYDELASENPACTDVRDANKAALYKTFGGRKAKLYIEREERMKVNIDVIKNQLDNTVENFEETDYSTSKNQSKDDLNKIRPPLNESAKKLEDIFNLTDIIPAALLNRLESEVDKIYETDAKVLPISSDFVLNEIEQLKNADQNDENRTKMKICIYIDALAALVKAKGRDMSKMTLSNITEKVETDIRHRFSPPEATKMVKTLQTKHKAICYFIALATLLKKNYEVNVNDLGQALSIGKTTILKFARAVNVKPKAKSDILSLCLPSKVTLGSLFIAKKKL